MGLGSEEFRGWLFGSSRVDRIDFLVNTGRWAFDAEPRYTVALLIASAIPADSNHQVDIVGVATSEPSFRHQVESRGAALYQAQFANGAPVPLIPSPAAAALLERVRAHKAFVYGGGRWRCFPLREFNETDDKGLWLGKTEGWALWKGESFDQFDPHGAAARWCPATRAALEKARKKHPGTKSLLAAEVPVPERRAAVAREVGKVRLAFRETSRGTDSRTVRASLVPAETFLAHTAPYLAFVDGGHPERAACCAVMNSLPFDWQARRFVETHLSYFILELLTVPGLDDATFVELVRLGGRLSCPDSRFGEVAEACGVEVGPLDPEERVTMRARVDALMARAYGLGPAELDVLLADFTPGAVPQAHRERMRAELEELCR